MPGEKTQTQTNLLLLLLSATLTTTQKGTEKGGGGGGSMQSTSGERMEGSSWIISVWLLGTGQEMLTTKHSRGGLTT